MRVTLAELACLLAGELEGDGRTIICGIAPLDQAQTGDVTFLTESKHAARLAMSRATAVLVAPHIPVDRPAIRVADPYLGFIHLLEHFFPPQPPTWGIDARAVLAPEVTLGTGVNIGPYVVIGRGVRLGDNVTVYPGTYIGEACEIGADCILYANVSLYPQVHLGRGVIIHSGAVIGDAVEIGANTCIDRATVGDTLIKTGVKLDNLVQIGHNSVVGSYSVLAGQVGLSGSVHVGSEVRMGGQVGIADHITVGDKVSISAQAGVLSDLEPGATVYGTPALPGPIAKRMHLYSLRLGELFQQVKQLQRRLDELEGREKRS